MYFVLFLIRIPGVQLQNVQNIHKLKLFLENETEFSSRMSSRKLDYPRYRKVINDILTPKFDQNPGQVYRQWTIATHYIHAVCITTRTNMKSASSFFFEY